jgi:hypothetical protein
LPVFISYSHSDRDFAEKLALQLVKERAPVWIDRWELNVGDSLIQRIQDAVAGASALLVVLSKASVASAWAKKELTAGLQRELEEKRVVVLPVLLEDCEVPLFLRDKLYADFRYNFDDGLQAVTRAIARFTNGTQSRIESADGHVDWGLDWGFVDGLLRMTLTFVDQPGDRPQTIITSVNVLAFEATTARYRMYEGEGFDWAYRHIMIETIVGATADKDLRFVLSGPSPESKVLHIRDQASELGFDVAIDVRLLGDDTGFDVLVDIGSRLRGALDHIRSAIRKPTAEESQRLAALLARKAGA